ncbi:MAG: helix-turn-helix domain-containing protein [Clostridia bacterium]|nr:helix-turn-helix domain-containing protein [Clostridia bacterium]
MINENIKNARKAKGISQEEMAAQLNVVRQTVSKWERGLSVPDADVLIRISDLLGVSVNDLLGVKLQDDTIVDLAEELAQLNEQLAVKNQEKNLFLQANKKEV